MNYVEEVNNPLLICKSCQYFIICRGAEEVTDDSVSYFNNINYCTDMYNIRTIPII